MSLTPASASLCRPLKPVETTGYTMYIHGSYMYIHGSYMYIQCTWAPIILCMYHWGDFHCKLVCNPFMIGLDSAYVQESAIWYIHCLEAYIHAKNHRGRWSAFLSLFVFSVFIHCSASFNAVQQLTYVFKRFWEKSHRKADHLPRWFLACIYASKQCMYQMADSCT
jgi:hypothetical protein